MKTIKSLVLLGMVIFSGCGGAHDPESVQGDDINPPSVELPQGDNPDQQKPTLPIQKVGLSVNCVWQYPEDSMPGGIPCNPEVILKAIDEWNSIANGLGHEDLFYFAPSNPTPDIMLFLANYKTEFWDYQKTTSSEVEFVQGGSYNYWEYIARALGFAIGLPVNPDENSIMKSFLQIDEYGTLGGASILQSDIDALDELL